MRDVERRTEGLEKVCALLAVCAALIASLPAAGSGVTLAGETSNPTNSCFARGAPVDVVLSAEGLPAQSAHVLEIGVHDSGDVLRKTLRSEIRADESGMWRGTFRMPSDDFGFYRVRPRIDGKLLLPQRGSCPAGCLTYAVLHDPATRRLYPQDETFFGLHGCTAGQAPWMGARIGHGYGTPHNWNYEKFRADYEAGRIAWKQYGFISANGVAEGRFADLFPAEAQAFAKTNRNQWAWFGDPVRERWFSEAMEKLARRARECDYGRAHGYAKRIYEIEWEPELTCPSRDLIVRRAKLSHAAIHRGDPEAVVAGPTLSTIGAVETTRWLFEHGLAEGIDAFAVHAYNRCPPESNDFLEHVRAIRRLVREQMGPDALVIGTEDGCNRPAMVPAEREQMQGMVRKMLILLGEGFQFNCPFFGYDHGDGTGDYGFCYNLCLPRRIWGPPRISPRPVFVGLSTASWYLEGHRPTCKIEWLGETVLGYAYQNRDGHCVLALWDWGGNDTEVELPVGRRSVTVGDAEGRERTVETADGKLTLTLGALPQYVPDVSPEIWGRVAQKKLNWSARAFRSATADAPLQVADVRPTAVGGGLGVRVEVVNATDRSQKGTVDTRIPGCPAARRSLTVELSPHERRAVVVPFGAFAPDPFALQTVAVAVTGADGLRVETNREFNFFPVSRRTPGCTPKFRCVPEQVVENAAYHSGPDDAAVEMAATWDEKGLYLAFRVTDDEFVQKNHGWHTWKGDALQLGFARDKDLKPTANSVADAVNRAFSELSVALTETGPEIYRTISWDKTRYPSGGPTSGDLGLVSASDMPRSVVRAGSVTTYRIMLPWAFVNVGSPCVGETVGFAATVNDTDTSGRQSRLGIFSLKDAAPRCFGTLTLADAETAGNATAEKVPELVFDGILGCSFAAGEPHAPAPHGIAWQPPPEVRRQDYTGLVHRAVACVGRLAETGELLVGTGYPERRVHLFDESGAEVTDPPWPQGGWFNHLVQVDGRTWGLNRGATQLTRKLAGKRPFRVGGSEAEDCSGLVRAPDGWWLRTRQGWLLYATNAPLRCVRRHGDLTGVTALAILGGRVIAFRGSRIERLWLDDRPDEPFQGSLFDNGRAGGRWTGTVDAAEVVDGKVRYSYSQEGQHWMFDPSVTEWIHRDRREYRTDSPVWRKSNEAALPGGLTVVADGKTIVLRDARGKTLQTLPVPATLLASEGTWLVAFVPGERALQRYRLENVGRFLAEKSK